ncbi:MAG: helix-turn-helix domain-containing protein [Thermodesulfobacteria bacterium]|nr:helix-turn-helix domain-containing protein [Thermodesulfobacteriota bacterium]
MAEEGQERFGEYLRKQREIRGFSLDEIAEQTKISLRALRAIEAEDWEILPAEIYVRGFIRCYCETIGLDPHEALLRFEEAYLPYKRQKEEKRHKETEYLTGKGRSPLFWVVLALVFLALLIMGGYFFWHKKSTPSKTILPSQTEEIPAQKEESAVTKEELPPPVKEETPGPKEELPAPREELSSPEKESLPAKEEISPPPDTPAPLDSSKAPEVLQESTEKP